MPNFDLTPLECRVLGCLLEKQLSTPDVYPLSMNGLLNACNQSSNRDPVLTVVEAEVQETVSALIARAPGTCYIVQFLTAHFFKSLDSFQSP